MRMAFGLVGLLVTLGIVALLWSIYTVPVVQEGQKAKREAAQYAGRDEDGEPAINAIQLQEVSRNGRFVGVQVSAITNPAGLLPTYYGLQVNDTIVSIAGLEWATISVDTADAARDYILVEGFEKKRPLIVMRNGQKISLPLAPGTPATPAAPGMATPTPPANPAAGIQQQLNALPPAAP